MRFSLRSRLGIALSLITLVAIVGAFAVSGFLRGSAVNAHAAGVGHTTLAQLKYRGVGSIKGGPKGVAPDTVSPYEAGPVPTDGSPKVVAGNPSNLPTTPPNPRGSNVTTSNPGFRGFTGITHADQRLANGGNQFSLEPPDQALCVGQGDILEGVNDALAVYSESGHVILKPVTALSVFFGLPNIITRTNPPTFGPFISDPKCYYDRSTARWFFTVLEIDTDPTTGAFANHSSTLIAVSQTSDPTGLWTIYSIDTTDDGTNNTPAHPGCPCFGDQPLIGADSQGFYISTNEFPITGPGFNGAQIYAVSKKGIEAAASSGGSISLPTVVHIDASQALVPFGGLSYSVQPATSPTPGAQEPNNGTEYFLSALDFNASLDNRVATWALTNTQSLNKATPSVNLSVVVIGSETYGQPPNATQKNGPRPLGKALGDPLEQLASNDDRMNQVVFSQGLLWSGVNTIVQAPNGNPRVGIAYFIVQPSWSNGSLVASMAGQGYVAVNGANVLFPSIGVTASGKAVMSFTLSGPTYYPSTAYTTVDVTNGTGDVHIAGAGQLPEDGFSGYPQYGGSGVARWGDYSAAVADGNIILLAAEFIPNLPRTLLANWGTFISQVNTN
ncbi:MAG TPA: hypothetical protein VFA41_18115 [Ktedonobacteraceae bacterium]|jgi:hypothetical protein|nr:hypothetical protein [Ktedonobacteraceae bacterium]